MADLALPLRIINSLAPIRVCDNGGWTDTWFACYGKVFNIAVHPCAEVQLRVFPRDRRPRITIHAENYGEVYSIEEPHGAYDKHPLLEAAFDYFKLPSGLAVEVSIHSDAPGGASTGTSAAVSVALVGALDCLRRQRLTPHQLAAAAQRIETELLHQQCGVQDQIAAAYGGINFIDIYQYPHATVSRIEPEESVWWELEARLALVFLGQAHRSSQVHEMVIRQLENAGPDCEALQPLRRTAEKSRDALYLGDFEALGAAMIENTEAQGNLHASLIGPDHARVIETARGHRALGWKVNGAGGEGGSVTLLCGPDRTAKRALLREIEQTDTRYRVIPIRLARHGVRRWEAGAAAALSWET